MGRRNRDIIQGVSETCGGEGVVMPGPIDDGSDSRRGRPLGRASSRLEPVHALESKTRTRRPRDDRERSQSRRRNEANWCVGTKPIAAPERSQFPLGNEAIPRSSRGGPWERGPVRRSSVSRIESGAGTKPILRAGTKPIGVSERTQFGNLSSRTLRGSRIGGGCYGIGRARVMGLAVPRDARRDGRPGTKPIGEPERSQFSAPERSQFSRRNEANSPRRNEANSPRRNEANSQPKTLASMGGGFQPRVSRRSEGGHAS